jgi:hypothetical protein
VILEVDTDPGESDRHRGVITDLAPRTRSVYIRIDPATGRMVGRTIYDPRTRSSIVRRGSFTLGDLRAVPALAPRRTTVRRPTRRRAMQREQELWATG